MNSKTKKRLQWSFKSKPLCVVAIIGTAIPLCRAHDQPVHEEISKSAATSSSGLSSFLSAIGVGDDPLVFNPSVFGSAGLKPVEWIMQGAYHEDDTPRFANHFYTVRPQAPVGAAEGMTDWHESLLVPGNTTNSFVWGTVFGFLSPYLHLPLVGWYPSIPNTETWPNARDYEFEALTNPYRESRDANLAHMLYALGHVIHLNQDLSQPDHVRNDEHFHSWHRWIENFGSHIYKQENGAFPLEPRGWAYWQAQGFTKLLDFWDRGHYRATPSALDAEASGSDKLGLAEFSNGNFLGEEATYAEFFRANNLHFFPFPSLANTTQPQLTPRHLSETVIDRISLRNHKEGDRVYISKTGAGQKVIHHSALNYFALRHPSSEMLVGLTINDTNVLQEYHSILIPKAIEYSAGILDYFFRGKIDVTGSGDTRFGHAVMHITNVSGPGEKFQGGGFRLFYEDGTTGVRTEIVEPNFTTTYSSVDGLGDQETTTATFAPVSLALTKYNLVFQGTIGSVDVQKVDPVDKNIALAVFVFYVQGAIGG